MDDLTELKNARLQLDNAEAAFKSCSYELHLLNCETVRPAVKEEARLRVMKIRELTKKVKAARAEVKHKRQHLRFAQRINDVAQATETLYGDGAWPKVEQQSKLLAKGRKQEKTNEETQQQT